MREANVKVLIIAMVLFFYGKANSQSFHFTKPLFTLNFIENLAKQPPAFAAQNFEKLYQDLKYNNGIPKKSYINQLPLFCKMEELIFKQSGLNLRINLGSNDQVRKLEGKY